MRRILALSVAVTSLLMGFAVPPCMGAAEGAMAGPGTTVEDSGSHAHAHHGEPDAHPPHGEGVSSDGASHSHEDGTVGCGPATACGSGIVPTLRVGGPALIAPSSVAAAEHPLTHPNSVVLSSDPPPPRLLV